MTAKRRRIQRQPRIKVTPEVLWAFQQCQKLKTQCTCSGKNDRCAACAAWWAQMAFIRNALRLPPYFWPVLPPPGDKVVSAGAIALYEELNALCEGTCCYGQQIKPETRAACPSPRHRWP